MKFIADVMLGRLARLMRFAGYDVEYDSSADDNFLLKRSRYRILLTKDRALSQRARPDRSYFVNTMGGEKQLREIQARFPQTDLPPRCLVCNHAIRKARKQSIRHLVPPFVYENSNDFYRCSGCQRVFWKGTHFDRMARMIK